MAAKDWKIGERQRLRARCAREQNWRCCHCGIRMRTTQGKLDSVTLEHVYPLSLGGVVNDWYNSAAACFKCNRDRGMDAVLTMEAV